MRKEHGRGKAMQKKVLRAFQLALCLAGLLLLAGGCVGIQTDPNSSLPSNTPAKWEGQSLAVPI